MSDSVVEQEVETKHASSHEEEIKRLEVESSSTSDVMQGLLKEFLQKKRVTTFQIEHNGPLFIF